MLTFLSDQKMITKPYPNSAKLAQAPWRKITVFPVVKSIPFKTNRDVILFLGSSFQQLAEIRSKRVRSIFPVDSLRHRRGAEGILVPEVQLQLEVVALEGTALRAPQHRSQTSGQ